MAVLSDQVRLELVQRVMAMTDSECVAVQHLVSAVKAGRAFIRRRAPHKPVQKK